jgi:AraC-like DNA-binding protein
MVLSRSGFRRLCHARDLLRDARGSAPRVDAIAGALGLSRGYFIRQFEATFGLTPHQFSIQARLDRARRLLAAGQLSVTDVCFEVGFSSLGSFSALFTHRVGEPPSAYRRRVRATVSVRGMEHAGLTPGCLSLMQYLPASALLNDDRTFREA